jgi:hypothetical protein
MTRRNKSFFVAELVHRKSKTSHGTKQQSVRPVPIKPTYKRPAQVSPKRNLGHQDFHVFKEVVAKKHGGGTLKISALGVRGKHEHEIERPSINKAPTIMKSQPMTPMVDLSQTWLGS